MKYAIVIPDGCADEPQSSYQGRTPLQVAQIPNMDRIAQTGIVGRSNNVPASLTAASDVATLSLFGYDPLEVYTGRSPLEVAAMGLTMGPDDWAIRCNLITVEDGLMRDFTAGHISSEEGKQLIDAVQQELGGGRLEFHAGVSYRNALLYRGEAPFGPQTKTQAPHDVPDQPIAEHLPQGPGSDLLCDLMQKSQAIFADHPVNQTRREQGKRPATQVWLWGQGGTPKLQPFADVFHKQGAILSAVDLVRGVGMLIGWKRIDVPGATGYLDTDYAAKGRYGVEALKDHDIVCVHVEAPDEASHEGKAAEKIGALEQIDKHVVGPLLEALPKYDKWRILVSPDHRTYLRTRAHAHGHVPFAVAGTGVKAKNFAGYNEVVAEQSPLVFDEGQLLMPWFLG